MYNWINTLYPVHILIIAYCHCSKSVYFHCRALRAFVHVCIPHESFQGSYPDPLNKHIYTIICAFVSIYCCRPSAWATPMLGVVINLQQKYGTQCGPYGWWLVSQKCINIKQQQTCWPAGGQPQSHTKIISIWQNNSSKCTNFQQQLTGQLWQCMIPSHSAVQMEPHAQGLCPYNNGGC